MNKDKFKTLFKSFLTLFSGQTIASFLGLVSALLLTKYIGLEKYGLIALSIAYINIFNLLFNFQSFNALIKFGQEALTKNRDKFQYYVKQAFLQDVVTALIAFIFAIFLAPYISSVFGWNKDILLIIILMSISILFNVSGSFIGILRLFGRFKTISINQNITALSKLLLILLGVITRQQFIYFIFVELSSLLLIYLINALSGIHTLKRNNIKITNVFKVKFDREFFLFNLYNNIILAIDLPTGEITKILINQFLGTYDLGLYNLLQKMGSIIFRISDPISIVVYPELTKLSSNGDNRKAINLTYRIMFFSSIISIVIIFLQYSLFKVWWPIFSDQDVNNIIVTLYFAYSLFSASTSTLHQLFIALNLIKHTIPIIIFANIVYFIALYFSTAVLNLGIIGFFVSLIIQAYIVVQFKLIIIKKNNK
jgi:O-antigen/teichoic acid export membrane protein